MHRCAPAGDRRGSDRASHGAFSWSRDSIDVWGNNTDYDAIDNTAGHASGIDIRRTAG